MIKKRNIYKERARRSLFLIYTGSITVYIVTVIKLQSEKPSSHILDNEREKRRSNKRNRGNIGLFIRKKSIIVFLDHRLRLGPWLYWNETDQGGLIVENGSHTKHISRRDGIIVMQSGWVQPWNFTWTFFLKWFLCLILFSFTYRSDLTFCGGNDIRDFGSRFSRFCWTIVVFLEFE